MNYALRYEKVSSHRVDEEKVDDVTETRKSAETLAKLRIARTQGIGPVTYRKLMQRYKNAADIITDWGQY